MSWQDNASPKGRYTRASARAEHKQKDSQKTAPHLATANAAKPTKGAQVPKAGVARSDGSPATLKKETKGGADRRPGKSKARAKPTGEPSKPKTAKLSRLESGPAAWSAEPERDEFPYHEDEDDLLRQTAAIERQNLEEEAISTLLNHIICLLEAEETISSLVSLPTPLPPQSLVPQNNQLHRQAEAAGARQMRGVMGTHWEKIGLDEPGSGTPVANVGLAAALQRRLNFSEDEVHAFGLGGRTLSHSSYIKAGNKYYRPARAPEDAAPTVAPEAPASPEAAEATQRDEAEAMRRAAQAARALHQKRLQDSLHNLEQALEGQRRVAARAPLASATAATYAFPDMANYFVYADEVFPEQERGVAALRQAHFQAQRESQEALRALLAMLSRPRSLPPLRTGPSPHVLREEARGGRAAGGGGRGGGERGGGADLSLQAVEGGPVGVSSREEVARGRIDEGGGGAGGAGEGGSEPHAQLLLRAKADRLRARDAHARKLAAGRVADGYEERWLAAGNRPALAALHRVRRAKDEKLHPPPPEPVPDFSYIGVAPTALMSLARSALDVTRISVR